MKAKVLYQNVLLTFGILSTTTQSWGTCCRCLKEVSYTCITWFLTSLYIHCFDCLPKLRLFRSTG